MELLSDIKQVKFGEQYLTFANYKEPLQEVKNGFGFMGVLLRTTDGKGVQCHICGEIVTMIGRQHLMKHGITAREYKVRFDLMTKTSLVSDEIRAKMKMRFLNWFENLSPELKTKWIEGAKKGMQKLHAVNDRGRRDTLEKKNKKGTCPDQLLDKVKVVAEFLKRTPTMREMDRYFGTQKYTVLIRKTFGSYKEALKVLGMRPKEVEYGKFTHVHTKEELIEYLHIFMQENGVPPTANDCGMGLIPSHKMYVKFFGSFPQARIEAGIYAELGRWVRKQQPC